MVRRVSLAVFLVLMFSSTALARSSSREAATARGFPAPPVRARAAVVLDASSGQVMDSVNGRLRLPMASTTKIMTALLALKMGKLTDMIRVPAAAFDYESDATVMGLHPGQVVSLRDLLYGLLLPSGADAANTIAIHYAGSEARFVDMMNQEAVSLGLLDTHYVDATGLHSVNHYTTAYDLARLGQYVSYLPDLTRITSTRYHRWNGVTLVNVNHVLFWYPGVDGIKPGYTDEAGLCQVIDVRRDGRHIVVAILNTPDLVFDARNLLNFGLRDFSWIQSSITYDSPALTQTGVDKGGAFIYFPSSGHYLHGAFVTSYRANGGSAVLGFPRTEPLVEGNNRVQYFENGALSLNPATGRVTRVALGMVPLPAPPSTPPPTVTPTPEPTATPGEGTIIPVGAGTPGPTATPRPRVTPTPRPTVVTPTAVLPHRTNTSRAFLPFQKVHAWLGSAVTKMQHIKGYAVQIFAYGALLSDPHSHAVYALPVGDRLLSARHFLPGHPGNSYPAGFAPISLLNAIGWLPSGHPFQGSQRTKAPASH